MAMRDDWLAVEDLLTDEERDVRDRVRAWADDRVRPVANDLWERAEFPADLFREMADLGVVGGTIEGHGCPGLSATGAHLVGYALASVDGSMSTSHGVHSSLAMRSIAVLGSDEQRERWLPAMARMERLGAFALTEPDHGSGVVDLATHARRDGDHWVLTGAKKWIGHGTVADVVVVWARDDDGRIGGFVVDHGDADGTLDGWDARIIAGKTGLRSVWQAEITLDGVCVPADNRLAESDTFSDTSTILTASRAGVAWETLGYAEAAYELVSDYVLDREQFGQPIGSFQLVQDKLARMLAQLTSLRLLCLRLGEVERRGELTMEKAALAKMHGAATARGMLADARDLFGGNGLLLEHHVARHHADVEAPFTYEGSDAVQALIVGRAITGLSAFA